MGALVNELLPQVDRSRLESRIIVDGPQVVVAQNRHGERASYLRLRSAEKDQAGILIEHVAAVVSEGW